LDRIKEEHEMNSYGRIVDFDEFDQFRDQLGRIVCTSGGFDPLHPGHASCIIESKKFGDTLVVVVNGDSFLRRKKGKAFMDLQTRCHIVSCVRNVDFVIPFEIDDDQTVCEALRRIRPDVFTKGGDRVDFTNIPEWQVCQDLGIELVPQVGMPKLWSSSDFLKEWGEYLAKKGVLPFSQPAHADNKGPGYLPPFPVEYFNSISK
jgi:cytidyltransferase-like protein